jgi:hypothetical protein
MTATAPRSISRAAFFLWLDRQTPAVTKADLHVIIDMAGFAERVRRDAHILVDEASEFDRLDPMLQALAPVLGLPTQEAIDAAFIEAVALRG